MQLKGKIVTGGASGIDLEAAIQFLELGAKVIVTGRNQERLDAAKSLLPNLNAIKSDVSNQDDVNLLFNAISELSGFDIL